jgi:hypothetical protein
LLIFAHINQAHGAQDAQVPLTPWLGVMQDFSEFVLLAARHGERSPLRILRRRGPG